MFAPFSNADFQEATFHEDIEAHGDVRLSWSEATVNQTGYASSNTLSGVLGQDPSELLKLGPSRGQTVRLLNSRLTDRSTLLVTAAPCTETDPASTDPALMALTTSVNLQGQIAIIHIRAPDGLECTLAWKLRWVLVNGIEAR